LLCPSCGSEGPFYRDGLRVLSDGSTAQRWLCRSCFYRFSESSVKLNVTTQIVKRSKPGNDLTHNVVSKFDFPSKEAVDGFSFLSGEDVASHVCPDVGQQLNSLRNYNRTRQVCDCLTEESKNLAEIARQEQAQREGAPQTADTKGKIIEFLWHLEKQGKSKCTILCRKYMLGTLVKLRANLFDPESVKDAIAKNPKWGIQSRAQAVSCYKSFARFLRIDWEPPKYIPPDSLPFIPLEKELDTLTHGSGRFLGTFLQGLKDTGADPGELAALRWIDINPQSKTVAINHPVKGHNARILKVSDEFLARINRIPKTKERIFANVRSVLSNFTTQRKRIANAYGNPRLLKITLRTFRHWKGTMEYHKTHDVYHVKRILGHKRLRSTEIYINLEQAVFEEQNDEFHVKTATTLEEACKLLEVGFEYVTDMDGYKLFRKRK